MKTGVFLNYIGLGANLMHLAYCHKIASIYGPITLISLAKNLDQALEDDQLIDQVIIFDKNKKITDIPKISSNLRKLNLDCIFIFYPSARLYLAAKLAGIKKVYCYPLFKKKELHLVKTAKKFTCESLNLLDCETETLIQISEEKMARTKKNNQKKNPRLNGIFYIHFTFFIYEAINSKSSFFNLERFATTKAIFPPATS